MFKKVLGLISLAVLMIIAGCSSSESSSEGKASSEDKNNVEVEELKIGVPSDVGPLNIYTGNMDWLTDLVYDKLFSPSPYVDEPQPWLAESAEQLDDTTWRVKIRSGIKWHDGEDFTAEDVKFTYEYYRDGPPNRHTHHVSEVPKVDTIEILEDGETLEFKCAYACPSMATITFADLPILPKHIWENVENPRKHTDLAIGTGPFKLTAYEPDQYYQFEANTDYFMGAPTVNKLSMPIIKDSTAMFNALTSGEIDTTTRTVPAELQETLQKTDSMKLASTSPLSIVQFGLNYEMEPFNSEEFRQAISLGIDRESIVSTVLLGQGRAGEKGYPHPDSPWTNPELSTPFNVEEANNMLDELGYEDSNNDGYRETPEGENLKLDISVSSAEPLYIRTAEMLQTQMKEIGIQFEVKTMDPTTYTAAVSEDDFDSYVSLIGPHGVADPDQFIMSHRSSYLWTKDLPYPEMDELVSNWMNATTIEDRKAISFDMQTLYNEQPTAIALYYPEEIYAYNADVYDQYVESLGFGIINKFSFLPEEAREVSSTTPVQLVE
ncbi:ABC transporter substrate-binding protein [Cytobacillus kochii]|uniref:ABC transporter substrate-binding protein n=1 Tax=Cytobacillus kochii TaxID=859143 RepID=UPI002041B5E0|nr:ABC transporter substrate-binding protein [Cytobacillus kochii]MCM3323483.1 ABC transporter substrate-binding protein [Cytobacillus kochii]MCM3345878.1 ABC transporter substrate-binding protein [Cytobacillus kochii]